MPRGQRGQELKEYQEGIYNSLKEVFGEELVEKEWNVAKNSRDDLTRKMYCPRIDIAVGPFRIDGTTNFQNPQMDQELERHRFFVERLFQNSESHGGNLDDFLGNRNENPRCFLAIEIEGSGSRKHMLGDVANASIIGSIGIIIPFNEKKLKQFKKIKGYITFATDAGKIRAVFKN